GRRLEQEQMLAMVQGQIRLPLRVGQRRPVAQHVLEDRYPVGEADTTIEQCLHVLGSGPCAGRLAEQVNDAGASLGVLVEHGQRILAEIDEVVLLLDIQSWADEDRFQEGAMWTELGSDGR